jgi:hypothetical protein
VLEDGVEHSRARVHAVVALEAALQEPAAGDQGAAQRGEDDDSPGAHHDLEEKRINVSPV